MNLQETVTDLEKRFGKGIVMKMSDKPELTVDVVPTGALTLDLALGIGGLPRGRIVEIYGPESAGKSTLAMEVVAESQRMGGNCAYIDAEHSMDAIYAKAIGVDTDSLYVSQPDYGEQGLEVAHALISSGEFQIIVIDSVPAMTPRAEIEGEMGDAHVGLMARMWSQAMRKLNGVCAKTNTMLLLVNQLREKIGVIYGSPEVVPGGRAIKFYSSVRLDVRRVETQKEGGEAVGNRTRVKVVKNKLAPPFRQAEFDIVFGEGINGVGCLLDIAADMGVVKKAGAWYSYGDQKMGQGRAQAVDWLGTNAGAAGDIEKLVRDTLGL